MSEIIKINDKTYRIEDSGVRFFLLIGDDKALMVDSGMNCKNAKEIVSELTTLPIELINTHVDPDHISGNGTFDSVYMHTNEIELYKKYGGDNEIISVSQDDIIKLGNRDIKIIELFGHSKGSIALLDINNGVLIGGDSIQDGNIFMFGEHRNIHDYVKSLIDLKKYFDDFDVIYPSHSSFPVDKDIIDKLIDGANKIINNEADYTMVNIHGNDVKLYKFEYAGFLC